MVKFNKRLVDYYWANMFGRYFNTVKEKKHKILRNSLKLLSFEEISSGNGNQYFYWNGHTRIKLQAMGMFLIG